MRRQIVSLRQQPNVVLICILLLKIICIIRIFPKFHQSLSFYLRLLRVNLIKEAASLPSSGDTVNSVLSLSFLTPENVDSYVDAIPEYEATLSKLCELLVAVRLGLPDVPESAVLSSIKGLSAALEGFKLLSERRRHFDVA